MITANRFNTVAALLCAMMMASMVHAADPADYWAQHNKDGNWRNASDKSISGTIQVSWAREIGDFWTYGDGWLLANWGQRSNNLSIRDGRILMVVPCAAEDEAESALAEFYPGFSRYYHASYGTFDINSGDLLHQKLCYAPGASGMFVRHNSGVGIMENDLQNGLINHYWNSEGILFSAFGGDRPCSLQFNPYTSEFPFGSSEITLANANNSSSYFAMSETNPLIYAKGGVDAHNAFAGDSEGCGLRGHGSSVLYNTMKDYGAFIVEDDMVYAFTLTNVISDIGTAYGVRISANHLTADPYSRSTDWTYNDANKVFLSFGNYHGKGAPRAMCLSDDGSQIYYYGIHTSGSGGSQVENPDPDSGGGMVLVGVNTSDGSEDFAITIPNYNPCDEYNVPYLRNALFPQIATSGKYVVIFQPQQKLYYSDANNRYYAHMFCFDTETETMVWHYDFSSNFFNTNTTRGSASYPTTPYQLEQAVQMTIAGDQAYIVEPYKVDVSGTYKLRMRVFKFDLNQSDPASYSSTALTPTDVDSSAQITVTEEWTRSATSTPYTDTTEAKTLLAMRELAAVDRKLVALVDVNTHRQALVVIEGSTSPSDDLEPHAEISAPLTGTPLMLEIVDNPNPSNQYYSGTEIAFSSDGSIDPDGGVLTYQWDFGDGSTVSTAANPTHTYASVDVYGTTIDRAVTLTVTDNEANTATATRTLRIFNLGTRNYEVIEPIADSYVNQDSPDSNYGAATALLTRYYNGTRPGRAYLKFDLSEAGITHTAQISNATLRMFMIRQGMYANSLDAKVCSDDSWAQGTITYNNAPVPGATQASQYLDDSSSGNVLAANAFVELDVTNAVKSIGSDGDATIVLDLEEDKYREFNWASTENADYPAPQLIMHVIDTSSGDPVADAGLDQTIVLPHDGTLDGSGSFDADGTITGYAWSKLSGGSANITSPSAEMTSITSLAAGDYVFQLVVTDNAAKSGTDTCNVTVENLTVTAASQSAANVPGQTVAARSNYGGGRVYVCLDGEEGDPVTKATLDAAVGAGDASWAAVTEADMDMYISTDGINAGTYYAFAVDDLDTVSTKGANPITITAITTVTRYVNTASSAGGDGTTNDTTGDHRAYPSLSAWNTAEQTDLTSSSECHVVICSGTTADSTVCNVSGWTTDDACTITIKTDSGISNSRHDGKWDTSAYRMEVNSASAALTITEAYVTVDGLQFTNANTAGNCVSIADSQDGVKINACICKEGNSGIYGGNGEYCEITNCVVYDSQKTQYSCAGIRLGGENGLMANNTVYGGLSYSSYRGGIAADKASTLVINNISMNDADNDFYGSGTESYNISSDTTASGDGSIADCTAAAADQGVGDYVIFYNISSGTEDFHLRDLDATHNVPIDAGDDLSAYFTTDIDGDTRAVPWDIGADDLGASGAPTVDTPSKASIESTTATLGGNISDIGDSNVTVRGVYWSTTNGFTPPGQGTEASDSGDWGSTGAFTKAVAGLPAGTTVYFKAFATNGSGTSFSAQDSFLTKPAAPTEQAATSVAGTSFRANWSSVTGATSYKLYVSTVDTCDGSWVGVYSPKAGILVNYEDVPGLTVSTDYYYKVVATNATGDSTVSGIQSVTTTAGDPPTVASPSSADITTTTATLGGNVTATGGSNVTERGIYWSTTDGFIPPGQGTKVSESGSWGTGVFTVAVASLPPDSTIYFKAFGVNSAATGYSDQESFITDALTPPALTADSTDNNVDNSIVITFTDDAAWRAAATAVKWGAATLDGGDYTLASGSLTINQGVIQTAAIQDVTIEATGYDDAVVSQTVNYGAATQVGITTQPGGPLANGGNLNPQPVVEIQDQYGNTVTSSSADVTAAKQDGGSWTLGGTATVAASSGVATFAGLTATSDNAVNGAQLRFTSSGLTLADSSTFNIPGPVAFDWYVSTTGNDTTGDGSSGNPYATIGKAITEASAGESILVETGTYTEAGIAVNKGVSIYGEGAGATIVQAHATQGSASDRVFNVTGSGDVVISDMTARHGNVTGNGGAVYYLPTAAGTLTVEYCVISDNDASGNGGGICAWSPGAGLSTEIVVVDSTFDGNTANVNGDYTGHGGGGMFVGREATTPSGAVACAVTGCTFVGNAATYNQGGGMMIRATGANCVVENSTFNGNTANATTYGMGGGICSTYDDSFPPAVYNCTIAGNSCGRNDSAKTGGGIRLYNSDMTIHNTIVADNQSITSGGCPDLSAQYAAYSGNYNLVETPDGVTVTGTGNVTGSDPGLAALADNGGPTDTMVPSAAAALRVIPRGSEPYYNDSPAEDQRGYYIDRWNAHPEYEADYDDRSIGAVWVHASATPARGFRGWLSTVNR